MGKIQEAINKMPKKQAMAIYFDIKRLDSIDGILYRNEITELPEEIQKAIDAISDFESLVKGECYTRGMG